MLSLLWNYDEPNLKLGSIWEHAPSSKSCNYVQFQGQINVTTYSHLKSLTTNQLIEMDFGCMSTFCCLNVKSCIIISEIEILHGEKIQDSCNRSFQNGYTCEPNFQLLNGLFLCTLWNKIKINLIHFNLQTNNTTS